ncbi:MAG: orotidine-5'-phosphate decarboxylase [Thermodesulfobacteriota bacterium]|nr:orotidine-5'-phosphate decarboxylase [Thermodesulfobacteriota bacterium]
MPDKKLLAKEKLIFPLDVSSFKDALFFIKSLKDHVGVFKVGLELFIAKGPYILKEIKETTDAMLFLDLKLHDIPKTVNSALKVAISYNVDFITVHCEQKNLLYLLSQSEYGRLKILGVTVLTSLDSDDLKEAGISPELAKDPSILALKRAELAYKAGCHGVVCSGSAIEQIRKNSGKNFTIVVPGIRPDWAKVKNEDQKRITTPFEAIIKGADYVVVGRPISGAKDPVLAAEMVVGEIEKALTELKSKGD